MFLARAWFVAARRTRYYYQTGSADNSGAIGGASLPILGWTSVELIVILLVMVSNSLGSKIRSGLRHSLLLFALCGSAVADEQVITADSRGFYLDSGFHTDAFDGYFTGWLWGGDAGSSFESRSFFVFNIPVLEESVTSATLTLWVPEGSYISGNSFENYTLWSVSTDAAVLVESHDDEVAIFNDLGSGDVYGSVNVVASDDGSYLVINLNAAAIAAINLSEGSAFAIGGSITTLEMGSNTEQIFINTNTESDPPATGPTAARLTLNPVPEPSTIILTAGSVGMCLLFRRRIRR